MAWAVRYLESWTASARWKDWRCQLSCPSPTLSTPHWCRTYTPHCWHEGPWRMPWCQQQQFGPHTAVIHTLPWYLNGDAPWSRIQGCANSHISATRIQSVPLTSALCRKRHLIGVTCLIQALSTTCIDFSTGFKDFADCVRWRECRS